MAKHSTNVFFFREIKNRTSIIRLKCAEVEKDTEPFKIIDEDNWVSEDENELKLLLIVMPQGGKCL